jgi:hypothetical protein
LRVNSSARYADDGEIEMTGETPIACSLSAEELPARLAEIRAIGADALLAVDGPGALRFRNDEATLRRLEAIVAAEAECCSFLAFNLKSHGDELELHVTAPDGAEALADDLVQAFAEGTRA